VYITTSRHTDRFNEEYFSVAESEGSGLLRILDIIHAGIPRTADLVTDLKLGPLLIVAYCMLAVMLTADLIDSLTVRPYTRHMVHISSSSSVRTQFGVKKSNNFSRTSAYLFQTYATDVFTTRI